MGLDRLTWLMGDLHEQISRPRSSILASHSFLKSPETMQWLMKPRVRVISALSANRHHKRRESMGVAKSYPRNHQERTAVSPGGGGRFLLSEIEDLSQCTDNNDLAVAPLSRKPPVAG